MYKTFIIHNGKPYVEKNGKAYEIEFNKDLSYKVTNNELKDISIKNKYFLREVLAKLNIKYNLANKKEVSSPKPITKEVEIEEVKVEEQPKNIKISKEK